MSDDLLKRLTYFAFKLEGKGQLESAASDAMAEAAERLSAHSTAIDGLRAEIERLRAGNEKLREALKPFAALFLWPDDIGDEWTVNDIRSGRDWDETENDTNTDDVFIKRGHIRAARKALESKP